MPGQRVVDADTVITVGRDDQGQAGGHSGREVRAQSTSILMPFADHRQHRPVGTVKDARQSKPRSASQYHQSMMHLRH
jgi:hypothetical protein